MDGSCTPQCSLARVGPDCELYKTENIEGITNDGAYTELLKVQRCQTEKDLFSLSNVE